MGWVNCDIMQYQANGKYRMENAISSDLVLSTVGFLDGSFRHGG